MKYNNPTLKCNFKKILKDKDISINKLSREIKERRATISELSNNKNISNKYLSPKLLAKICLYLDIDLNELFDIMVTSRILCKVL